MTPEETITQLAAAYNAVEADQMLRLAAMLTLISSTPGHMVLAIGGTPHRCPNNLDDYGRELWAKAVLMPLDRGVEFRSR